MQSFRNEKHDNVFFDVAVYKMAADDRYLVCFEWDLLQVTYDLLQL